MKKLILTTCKIFNKTCTSRSFFQHKINLINYWTKLVDPDSITVTLTPIGKHQKLYVEDIADNVVTVASGGLFAGEINCFFVVYGERVDIDKLIVESK